MSNVWQWDNFITPEKRARLEQLLQSEFSYHQLLFLTYDHFWEVYQAALGDDHAALARRLVDYAAKHHDTDKNLSYLHGLLQKHCPLAYKKYQAEFNWNELGEQYRQAIIEKHSRIDVFGNKLAKLEGIFTDVYVLDEPSALRRFDILTLKHDPEKLDKQERMNALDLVKNNNPENQRLFILGKPGAGKTTFVRYLALQATHNSLAKIPFLVELKQWAKSGLDLTAFMKRQLLEMCHMNDPKFLEALLMSPQTLVLFDGLDEVNQANEQRRHLVETLQQFSQQYRSCQILITCRIAANDYSLIDNGFTYLEIADFNDLQMRTFVGHWFGTESEMCKQFLANLDFNPNQRLKALATTPILLNLLCLTFEDMGKFPIQRSELYEWALEIVLKKWDERRTIVRDNINIYIDKPYRTMTLDDKEAMLSYIAYKTFINGDYLLRRRDLEQLIKDFWTTKVDSEAVLKEIEAQHGILIERTYGIYSFAHTTFHEYFAAKYIVEHLADHDSLQTLVTQYLTDNRWREIFLLIAEMWPKNNDMFMKLFHEAIYEFVISTTGLINLLQWANQHTQQFLPQTVSYIVLRFAYINIEISLRRNINFINTHALARDIARFLDIHLEIALYFAFELTFNVFDNIGHSLSFAARSFSYNIVGAELGFDFSLLYLWQFVRSLAEAPEEIFYYHQKIIPDLIQLWSKVIALSHSLNQSLVKDVLNDLSFPSEQAPQIAWLILALELRIVMQLRDLGHDNLNLTTFDIFNLDKYFEANKLFLRCLEVANLAHADKARLKNSLFLPPQSETL